MKKIAILCNGVSSEVIDRKELIKLLQQKGYKTFVGEIFDGTVNNYYALNNISFIPIIASRNNTNPFNEIKSIHSVKKQIEKEKIESVIIYGVKNHAAMSIGSKLGGAKRIMCVVNGSGNLFKINGLKGKLLRIISFPMLWIAYKFSKCVCFQNKDDLEFFKKKHLITGKKEAFVTGGSGVNLAEFPFSFLPESNNFLYLARITLSKGIKEYIEAAYIVKKEFKSCRFDIYGGIDSTIEGSVGDILDRAINDGVVEYHGKTNDVKTALKKCRFFVYPSYYPEGVSRCLLQAISTGRPIITSNMPGCRETVIDGVNGFLVEKQNVKQLVDKMRYFLNNKDKMQGFGVESRKIAEEHFDINVVNKTIISHLEK